MKRKQFVSQLVRDGCKLLRPGARHDIYVNPHTGQKQPVPRHTVQKSITFWQNTSESIWACNDDLYERNAQQSHSHAEINPNRRDKAKSL